VGIRLRRQRGLAPDARLVNAVQASLDRFAIREALSELGIVTIRSRD
jgi:hypothetical protein